MVVMLRPFVNMFRLPFFRNDNLRTLSFECVRAIGVFTVIERQCRGEKKDVSSTTPSMSTTRLSGKVRFAGIPISGGAQGPQ